MGLLTVGKPLKWGDSVQHIDYIKKHGIEQFINLYRAQKDRRSDSFKWGDELEYLLLWTPSKRKVAKLSLRSADIMKSAESKMDAADDPMDGVIFLDDRLLGDTMRIRDRYHRRMPLEYVEAVGAVMVIPN